MKQSRLTIITDLLLIAIAFIIFVDNLIEIRDTVYLKARISKKIFQNTDIQPITSISVGRNYCPDDNSEYMFQYSFSGVTSGSYISSKNAFYPNHNCEQNEKNCIDIPELKPKEFKIWKDKVICLTRLEKLDKYDQPNYLIYDAKTSCPTGYRRCGYYNTFSDKICMKQALPCMINYINITKTQPSGEYENYKLKEGEYIAYSNNMVDEIIPVDFKVSEGIPCIETDRLNDDIYPLVNDYSYYGCNQTYYYSNVTDDGLDYRYKLIDTDTLENFFQNNDILRKYAKLPPVGNWRYLAKTKVNLFVRNYISFNYTQVEVNKYNVFKQNLDRLKVMKYINLVVSLGNLVFICMVVSFLGLMKLVKRMYHQIIGFLKIFLSGIFITFSIAYSYKSIDVTNKLIDFVVILKDSKSIQPETEASMYRNDLVFILRDIDFYNKALFYLCIAYGSALFVQLIRLIAKTCFRIKYKKRTKLAKKALMIKD